MPAIGSFDDPSLVNRNEAFRSGRRRLHFDGPLRAICFQPCVQRMVAILVVTEDHFQTRQVFDCDARQQFRGGSTVIQICCGDNNDNQQTQCIHQQMTLAALDFLCAVLASLVTTNLRRFYRLRIDTGGTGSGFSALLHTDF